MRSIIVQELIRAAMVLILLIWGSAYLHKTGMLDVPGSTLVAASGGISAVMFAVLVVVRMRTGKEFMLKRGRYLVTLALAVGVPVFIWLMLEGEVTRAVLSAIGMLFVCLSLFIFRKKLQEKVGLKW